MRSAVAVLFAMALTCPRAEAAYRGVTDTSLSPHARLRSVALDDVRWTEGFWADGDCYKWLEAVAHVHALTEDPRLDRLMDRWIEIIGKAQAPDGYISINIQLTSKGRFANPHHHEIYNMGHLLTAACIHHRASGKDNFLELPLHLGGAEAWQTGVFLPENVEFTPHKEEEFLGGVTVLKGTALTFEGRDRFVEEVAAVEEPLPQQKDWRNMLYRPLQPRRLRQAGHGTTPVTLTPYFAWANRGESYMEVWIPLAR